MKDLLKQIMDYNVARTNKLRYTLGHIFDHTLRSDDFDKVQKVQYLKNIFGWDLQTCQRVVLECNSGKSFTDITNELNIEGKL